MRAIVGAALAAGLVMGCSPPEEPAAAPVGGPASTLASAPEFATCEWGEVTGAGLAIGAFTCGADQSSSRLVADDSLPGLWLQMDADGTPFRRLTVRTFPKAADAPVETVVEAVRAASPGPFTARCQLAPIAAQEGLPDGRFSFEPVGEDAAAWEASVSSDAPMEAPCGEMGPAMAGDRYFAELQGDPTRVAFVELGSEIQIYDPATLRAAP